MIRYRWGEPLARDSHLLADELDETPRCSIIHEILLLQQVQQSIVIPLPFNSFQGEADTLGEVKIPAAQIRLPEGRHNGSSGNGNHLNVLMVDVYNTPVLRAEGEHISDGTLPYELLVQLSDL